MKYWLYSFLVTMLVLTQAISAQDINSNSNSESKNHAIYLEALGMGGLYSLNYEHKVGKKLWLRSGISYFPDIFENFATLPLGLIYLKGDQNKYLEMGIGSTIFTAGSDNLFGFDFNNNDGRVVGASVQAIIGYRYMPEDENFIFKVTFYPAYFPASKTGFATLGISIGSSF